MSEDDSEFDELFDEEVEETGPTEEEYEKFHELIADVRARCEEADIGIEEDEGGEFDVNYDIYFPENRSKRRVTIWDIDEAEFLLSINFENIRFIEGYNAFYSIKTGLVSAQARVITPPLEPYNPQKSYPALRMISTNPEGKTVKDLTIRLASKGGQNSPQIVITAPSKLQSIMTGPTSRGVDLMLMNMGLDRHDHAKSNLEKLSDSIFFQIEAETKVALNLVRRRTGTPRPQRALERTDNIPSYNFPKIEYYHDPLTFYWYATSARQMPLVQYLAFYQAIEFYYPIYSDEEAKRAVKNILKRPNFHPDREVDISQLLDACRGGGSRGIGSERAQLRATLKACVDEKELAEFLASTEQKKEFFVSDKLLSVQRISLEAPNPDIVRETADRIYEIRCRIVHTKAGDEDSETRPLLPYTKEEQNLHFDIGLIKFVANKVISTSGGPLTL